MNRRLKNSSPVTEWPAVPSPFECSVLSLLAQLEETQWWSYERLVTHQERQLATLLTHYHQTSPFFRKRLTDSGLTPGEDITLDTLGRLPLLTRGDLQTQRDHLCSSAPPKDHGALLEANTSGSMGIPVHVRKTEVSQTYHFALNLRNHIWHGRDFSNGHATIQYLREDSVDFPEGFESDSWAACYYTGPSYLLNFGNCDLEEQLDWLIRKRPAYILSYPTILAALADLSEESGVLMPWLQQVMSFSEAVTPNHREVIERVWRVPLIDSYSNAENSLMALQCPDHQHYHVQSESVILEVIDEDGSPTEPGKIGRVVVTDLHNFIMPFIRYETGDMAELGHSCPCGRGLPVLNRIYGRTRNFIRLESGARLFPYMLGQHDLSKMAPVRQLQVIQRSYSEMEMVMAVHRPLSASEEESVLNAFRESISHPFTVRPVYVDEISRSPSGKFEDFRCEIVDAR